MIHAGVEIDILEQQLLERRSFEVLCQPAKTAPVERHRAAAVRNDEAQRRELLEQIGSQELHERGGVGVQIVRPSSVEIRIAGSADVHHGGHIEFHHLLVQRIPMPVGQRRGVPMTSGRVGIEVAADEAQLAHAALELCRAVGRGDAGGLRQLADTDEVLRIQLAYAVDQLVADARPLRTDRLVAEMMPRRRGPRRKYRQVGAALALQFELRFLEAVADLIVADARALQRCRALRACEPAKLRIAKRLQRSRRGRVVAMAVDDHESLSRCSSLSSVCMAVRHCVTLALGSRRSRIAAKNSRSCSSMPFSDTSTFDTSIWMFLPSNRSS